MQIYQNGFDNMTAMVALRSINCQVREGNNKNKEIIHGSRRYNNNI